MNASVLYEVLIGFGSQLLACANNEDIHKSSSKEHLIPASSEAKLVRLALVRLEFDPLSKSAFPSW